MIDLLLNVVVPVFFIVSLGWGWIKLKYNYDSPTITSLVMNIGAPSLVFSTLSSLSISTEVLSQMALAALVTIFASAILIFIILKLSRISPRSFLPPLVLGNTGNMGLPICYFAFGDKGLALSIIAYAVYSVSTMTLGLWIYSGEKNPFHLLKAPIVYAVIFSIFLLANGLEPPAWILKTTKLLGQFTIPMMLFTLGVSLARLDVVSIKKAVLMSSLRLGLGLVVGLVIADLMGLSGIARGVLILQSSMPVAVFNYLLAERYDRNAKEVAELVFVSTLLSLFTLPLIIRFLT